MYKIYLLICIFLLGACGNRNESKTPNSNQEASPSLIINSNKLKDLNLNELRLLRNEIFARKGYIFKAADLQEYFAQQQWYTPLYQSVDSLLTPTDLQNIERIEAVESELRKRIIPLSVSELNEYKRFIESNPEWNVIPVLENVISLFRNKPVDTSFFITGHIRGYHLPMDTIWSRVFYYDGKVTVNSEWKVDGTSLWSSSIDYPSQNLFDEMQNPPTNLLWYHFAAGIVLGTPSIAKYPNSGVAFTDIGANDCDNRQHIKEYFSNIESDLVVFNTLHYATVYYKWYALEERFVEYSLP